MYDFYIVENIFSNIQIFKNYLFFNAFDKIYI